MPPENESTTPTRDRDPIAELSKRASEAGGALAAAKAAVGLEDHRRMLADHAQRLRDSHRCMMQAAGFDPPEAKAEQQPEGEDVGGGIIITGDNYYHNQQQPQASGPVPSQPSGIPSWLRTAALVASMGVAGAAGATIPALLTKDEPVVVEQPAEPDFQDTRTDFDLSQE